MGVTTMANAEKVLYTTGNPLRYEPVSAESAYTELDRENSRLKIGLARLRGELDIVRAELKTARAQTWVACAGLVAVAVGAAISFGVFFLR
jgi:hypothetical protein